MRVSYPEQKPNVEVLVTDHLELVKKIAWHIYGRVHASIEVEDLIQTGYYGLVLAAQNYTVQEGASFASYASIRIRGTIIDHLRKSSNLCRTTIQMQQKTKIAEESLRQTLGRDPNSNELAEDLGISNQEMMDWEHAFQANVHQSLDGVYDEFSIWFVSDENTPEEQLNETEMKNLLKDALRTLPEKEALVIQLYYVEELNVYEIAEVLEVTTGRVSQIKSSAVRKLREFMQKANQYDVA
ncbi:MAG: FliA/WhiG family RNA polymerase sigma factor [Alphaproteobacteria bacterium]|nr:FliA/WhiG family RNA polymerase sigma factor [Alphaproteobacteria bacterium]